MTLTLGRGADGAKVRLTDEERSRHIHVVGASGSGKSKLLESLLRQDITAGRGLCLIDPHGTLADDVIRWCAATGMNEVRKIHIIDPSNPGWSVGFNPLRNDGRIEPSLRADAMIAACAQVWGGENPNATPLLRKCLRSVFYTLAVRDLTLVEAPILTTSADLAVRRTLTDNLPDMIFDAYWREFEALQRREFAEQFSSTNNRLLEFLAAPVVRSIIGQRENVLDLRHAMDHGEILIVNLKAGATLSAANARLLGTLLTSDLFLLALTRDPETAKERPFTLYVDECYDFLTDDIEHMLDQTRKFGLHLVLSHQRLGQLRRRSEHIFNGVMAGGQTKIVFGGMADEDAGLMASEVMRPSLNLERPKHVLDKPVVVDEVPYWLHAESETESESLTITEGQSESWGSGLGGASGLSQQFDRLSRMSDYVESSGSSWSDSSGGATASSEGRTTGWSKTQSRSQTLKPVRVVMPTAVYSLEEEMHRAVISLREQPIASAIVKRPGKPALRIQAEFMRPALASDQTVSAFVDTVLADSRYLAPRAQADAEITARRKLLGLAREDAPINAAFWTEEES